MFKTKYDPRLEWNSSNYLLANILDSVNCLIDVTRSMYKRLPKSERIPPIPKPGEEIKDLKNKTTIGKNSSFTNEEKTTILQQLRNGN